MVWDSIGILIDLFDDCSYNELCRDWCAQIVLQIIAINIFFSLDIVYIYCCEIVSDDENGNRSFEILCNEFDLIEWSWQT